MIGYKVYNSLNQRWETYINETPKVQEYPSQFNYNLALKVLNKKESSYNNNSARIDNFISNSRTQLENSSLDKTLIQTIKNRFNAEYMSVYNSKGYDLSSNSLTDNIINWLRDGLDNITRAETTNFNNQSNLLRRGVPAFTGNYGGFTIPLIEEYVYSDKKWNLIKSEKNNGFIYYDGNIIYSKRGNENWIFRQLDYKSFDKALKVYWYNSPYGETTISEYFTTITFYNSTIEKDKKYIYTIGNMDKSIKLK